VDPITLFALANGAVKLVKEGCKLYKDISSAAGDVKGVLKDLEDQFHSAHKDRPATVAEKNQYIQEKNRVIELSKKQPDDIYAQIGENLGTYFENMATCMAIFEDEERRDDELYTGETSLGKRALQRVLMQTKLEAMQVELREIMVYQCPPELGDLYTRVEAMMVKMQRQQSIAITNKMHQDRINATRRRRKLEYIRSEAWKYGLTIFFALFVCLMIWAIVQVRIEVHPEFGRCLIPKGQWPYELYNNLKWIDCEIPIN
jgi:hypothetical protein